MRRLIYLSIILISAFILSFYLASYSEVARNTFACLTFPGVLIMIFLSGNIHDFNFPAAVIISFIIDFLIIFLLFYFFKFLVLKIRCRGKQ